MIDAWMKFTSLYTDHGLLIEDPFITTFADGNTP